MKILLLPWPPDSNYMDSGIEDPVGPFYNSRDIEEFKAKWPSEWKWQEMEVADPTDWEPRLP